MIDDIVLLPRRLKQFKRDAKVSSELLCSPPMSSIARLVGYEVPDDTLVIPFGTGMNVPTGVDTWFRFKLIENTVSGIVEYFCLSESPVDIFNIKKSKRTRVYCIWVSLTDPVTFRRRKYVLWEHIRALMRYEIEDSVNDVPVETVIANELRAFADVYGCPEIFPALVNYPSSKEIVRISELGANKNEVDTFLKVVSNIKALNEIYDVDTSIHSPDPTEVFRGTDLPEKWTDISPLKRSTVIKHLMWGPVDMKELFFLFGAGFGLHCFQRGFNTQPLPGDTEISTEEGSTVELFSIIEYIETIPYGEFELTVKADGTHQFRRFNPFDMNVLSREKHADLMQTTDEEVTTAVKSIAETICNNITEIVVARSWAEEAYITFKYADGTSRRFYFDLAVYALCSRSLFRDYQVPSFIMG